MVWSVAEPSTICTSSSPFGWRSHAPWPANLALKILPSRNGANVAKAPLAFRSTSVVCGVRPRSSVNLANSALRSRIVTIPPSMADPLAPGFPRSGTDADDLVPVGRVLVGVGGPHEERIVEETPDELHADRETRRRLAHRESERGVSGVVEGQGVAVAAPARRHQVVLDGLLVAARPVVLGCRHDAGGHHEHV